MNPIQFNLALQEAHITASELYSDLDHEEALDLVLTKIESMFNCSLLEWTF